MVTVTLDDLRDWVLVHDGAERWLGRFNANWASQYAEMIVLDPAYAVLSGWNLGGTKDAPHVDGRYGMIVPIEFMASATIVHVRPVSVIPLSTFDEDDREGFVVAIRNAEAGRKLIAEGRGKTHVDVTHLGGRG